MIHRNYTPGFVYLLHFKQPIANGHACQHYLGYCDDLAARIQSHRIGRGARLTAVAKERNIPFQVVRAWRGDRQLERALKRRKYGTRLCPLCGPGHAIAAPELSRDEIRDQLVAF